MGLIVALGTILASYPAGWCHSTLFLTRNRTFLSAEPWLLLFFSGYILTKCITGSNLYIATWYCIFVALLFHRIDKNQDMKIDWVEWRDYFDLRSAESLEDILKLWRCPPVSAVICLIKIVEAYF